MRNILFLISREIMHFAKQFRFCYELFVENPSVSMLLGLWLDGDLRVRFDHAHRRERHGPGRPTKPEHTVIKYTMFFLAFL